MNSTPEEEVWKPVVGHEGRYEVSSMGRVRSMDRITLTKLGHTVRHRGKLLNPSILKQGYRQLKMDGVQRTVHTLVLEAFVGPRPDGFDGCHNDGNPENNRVENLRWDTRSANQQDRARHAQERGAAKTHCRYGHEYIRRSNGKKVCRECHNRRSREQYAKYGKKGKKRTFQDG